MKLKTFALISIISLSVFFLTNVYSWSRGKPMSEEAVLGKKVWQENNCISCHTLFGNGGYEGDDMTHIVEKRSEEEFIQFFQQPPYMRPHILRVHPGLTIQATEQLWSYFSYLNDIPTLGWPPEPHRPEGGL